MISIKQMEKCRKPFNETPWNQEVKGHLIYHPSSMKNNRFDKVMR